MSTLTRLQSIRIFIFLFLSFKSLKFNLQFLKCSIAPFQRVFSSLLSLPHCTLFLHPLCYFSCLYICIYSLASQVTIK